jgi:hypothetical protein
MRPMTRLSVNSFHTNIPHAAATINADCMIGLCHRVRQRRDGIIAGQVAAIPDDTSE